MADDTWLVSRFRSLAAISPGVSGFFPGSSVSRNSLPRVLHTDKALMESSRDCGDLLPSKTPGYRHGTSPYLDLLMCVLLEKRFLTQCF